MYFERVTRVTPNVESGIIPTSTHRSEPLLIVDFSRGEPQSEQGKPARIELLKDRVSYVPLEGTAYVDGERKKLSKTDISLLRELLGRRGRAVSRDRLLEVAWPEGFMSKSSLGVAIKKLRDKIEPDPQSPTIIFTEKGLGYRLGEHDESDAVKLPGEIKFFRHSRELFVRGEKFTLPPKEHDVLMVLSDNVGRVVSREEIGRKAWSPEYFDSVSMNTIDVRIGELRDKIEPDPENPITIITELGLGFRLGEVDDIAAEAIVLPNNTKIYRYSLLFKQNNDEGNLTIAEHTVILRLHDNPGLILSRSQLQDSVMAGEAKEKAVDIHIGRIRSKLGIDIIETVIGTGYRFRNN